jgi:hypothetical protein
MISKICGISLQKNEGIKMENAVEKLTELNAVLLAMTGSVGTSELESSQVDALLNVCLRLSGDALRSLSA